MAKTIMAGDWIIREGPEIKVGDFGAFSGEVMPSPLLMHVGMRELELATAFLGRAIYVLDVTEAFLTVFDPFQGQPVIIQLSHYMGTWRLASQAQVEVTWTLAKKACRQEMIPLLESVVSKYPYRDRRLKP
jgi:hypothetical protein